MAQRIIAPLDYDSLTSLGLLSPASPDGICRIHRRRLNRSSDEEYSHLPLTPISTPPDSTLPDPFVSIPDILISEATIRYLGYEEQVAKHLWDRWTNWPAGSPVRETDDDGEGMFMPFIEFISGHAEGRGIGIDTAEDDDVAWRNCLAACGVRVDMQDAIMDPVFKHIRLTESCLFWIRDTLEMRYRGLQEIQKTSLERETAILRARSHPSEFGSGPGGHGDLFDAGGASAPGGVHRSVSTTQRQRLGIEQDTAMSRAALSAQNAPGYTVLYKGLDQSRIDGLHDASGNVVALEKLLSGSPTDFHRAEDAYYFGVDREIAVYYANYAKRRVQVNSVVVIHMAIPNSAIESLSTTELVRTYWPSEEWKNLIFHCRKNKKLSSALRKFKDATLIIGTTSKKPSSVYEKMESPEEIVETMVLKTKDGRSAVQYVFSSEEGEDFLMENGQLQVFPMTATEYEDWRQNQEEAG